MNFENWITNFNPITLWVVIGILLVIAEMISASFFLIFLALGCFMATLTAIFQAPWPVQVLTAITTAIFGSYFLRQPIQRRFLKNLTQISDLGATFTLDCSIKPNEEKRVSYQGTTWIAINIGEKLLNQGDRVIIHGVEGNKLKIKI